MCEIFSLLQLRWIYQVLEEYLRTGIHHLQIVLVGPWLRTFAWVWLNGLVLLYYLRCQLLLHCILNDRELGCLLRYLLRNVDPHSFAFSVVQYAWWGGGVNLSVSIWCLLSLLANFIDECLSRESIGIKVPFHRLWMQLDLAIEALSNPTKPLRWQLLLALQLVLLVREVLLRLNWHRTSFNLLQLLHALPTHELLLLLR